MRFGIVGRFRGKHVCGGTSQLRPQIVGHRFRDLALDREDVSQFAIIVSAHRCASDWR